MRNQIFAGLITMLLASWCVADATTQPVKPKSDERQVIDKMLGYSFNVPKVWREIEQKGGRSIHVFQLPAPGGAAKAASSWIILAEEEKKPIDLEKFADRMRDSIMKRAKEAKIESEKSVQFLGLDAWEIVYTMKMQMKIITQQGKDKVEQTEDVATRVRTTLFLYDGYSYQLILTSDDTGYQNRVKAADRMLTTFKLAQPQTAKP